MGATELCWTDRHAYTIVEIAADGKLIVVQADAATLADQNGMSDAQNYTYTPDTMAPRVTLTLRKNGRWVRKRDTANGTSFAIGVRREYHDYGFM